MMLRTRLFLTVPVVVLLSFASQLAAGDKNNTPQVSTVKFVVLKDDNGKPVRNAALIMHPVNDKGKQAKGGAELKTDGEGKTEFEGIPYGSLRVQVIAHGFQTFGDDFTVNQPTQEITIRLKRPQDQYTIYGDQKKPQ